MNTEADTVSDAWVSSDGVTIVGDLLGDFGLASAARRMVDALLAKDVPVSLVQLVGTFARREPDIDARYAALPRGSHGGVNLLVYGLLETALRLTPQTLLNATRGKYTIANWYWEQPLLPPAALPALEWVDEVWVASHYVREIFATANIKARVIPPPITLLTPPNADRQQFDIPQDSTVFLFTFNAGSFLERKNPFAVVQAFAQAFGQGRAGGPLLIIKAHHIDKSPQARVELTRALEQVNGMLIDTALSRQQMDALLACADVYVSLHRAEGFGLGMAEAMALGKPVIATAYSANIDFMAAENSVLIPYTLRDIERADYRYDKAFLQFFAHGQRWAEPDIAQAAAAMQRLFDSPTLRHELGQRAAESIRQNFSTERTGTLMIEALQEIQHKSESVLQRRYPQLVPTGRSSQMIDREQLNAGFDRFNQTRLDPPLARLPLIGKLIAPMLRVRNLGKVWRDEAEMLLQLIQAIEVLEQRVEDLEAENQQLRKALSDRSSY